MKGKGFVPVISAAQIKVIHSIKNRLGWDEEVYRHIISEYTNGRCQSSKGMTRHEAMKLIERFTSCIEKAEARELVKTIYALSFEIEFLNKDYKSSSPEETEINKAKISTWLKSYGKVKKPISQMSLEELMMTVKQLQKIAKKRR